MPSYIVYNKKTSNSFELLITSIVWVTVNQNHIIVALCRKGRKCHLIDVICFLYTNEFPSEHRRYCLEQYRYEDKTL